jgi:hypothetical protein
VPTDLIVAGAWSATPPRRIPVATLDHGPPVVDRIPGGPTKVTFSFVFGPLPPRWRYEELFLRIQFEPPTATAVDVQATTIPLDAAPASIWTTGGNTIGCLLTPPSPTPEPITCSLRFVVDAPGDLGVLNGFTHAEASVRHPTTLGLMRANHIRTEPSPFFAVPLPGSQSSIPAAPAPAHPSAAVRLCLAADIENFSRFHSPQATRAQHRFVNVLASARRHAGIDETQVELQHAGDGQLAILPPAIDESIVIPRLVEGLSLALAETNADLNDHARLRIRVALHRGHVSWGINGWIGDSTIAVHRIIDCPEIRTALRDNSTADFALIVPETLYNDVISHQYPGLDPHRFYHVTASLPDKNFTEPAWIHVP